MQKGAVMDIKEILIRIGYVRNQANLSARELSQKIGMSQQYVAKLESGNIVLTVEKLLKILDACAFPVDRFFSNDIQQYSQNNELKSLIQSLPPHKKRSLIDFLKR